jgi:signal peptidase I
MDEGRLGEIAVELKREALRRGLNITAPTCGTSMVPIIRPKNKVVVTGCPPDKLRCGDIIVFQPASSRHIVAGHRLIFKKKSDGQDIFYAKGDSQRRYDLPIYKAQVLGKIIKIKKRHFSILLDSLGGRILNFIFLVLSVSLVLPFALMLFGRLKSILRKAKGF